MMPDLNIPSNISLVNLGIFILYVLGIFVYKLLFPYKKINLVLILIFIAIIPTLSLFRHGTFEAGDLRPHTAQFLDFFYNLKEGVIIPRWSGNLCGGYGCPIYIIEYTLPYYFGSIFYFLGFSALTSIKLVLASSFVASGITMYFWAKESFGKIPGFFSALLYLFTPYHLITMHFRGSVGEVMAFVFIPIIFLLTKKLIEFRRNIYFVLLPLTILALILSHSSTTSIILPVSIGYALTIWYFSTTRVLKNFIFYITSFFFGVLLSSFYWLPAITEVKYTWWGHLSTVEFRPIQDYLISTSYLGLLYQLSDGRYTPIIGYFQILFVVLGLYALLTKKFKGKINLILIYFILVSLILFILMLQFSKPVWESLPILKSFLFSFRLLVPLAFVNAAIGAILITKVKNIKIIGVICFLLISITILNWANRKMVPELINPFITSDAVYTEYYENRAIYDERRTRRGGNLQKIFTNSRINDIEFVKGHGSIQSVSRKQEMHAYIVNASGNSILKDNTYYFPGWKVFINNKEVPINYEYSGEENFGKIVFPLKSGLYQIEVFYKSTYVEKISKFISIFSILLIVAFLIKNYLKKNRTIDKAEK